jgi:hypothetical protein
MEVRGKVTVVQPVQTGEGRNGQWKKQDYVIEYDQNSQYPRKMLFNLWGDKIDQYNIQEGQLLRISFDIECREYNGRYYNDIRAWKVEADDGMPTGDPDFPSTPLSMMSPPPPPVSIDESSDLPF